MFKKYKDDMMVPTEHACAVSNRSKKAGLLKNIHHCLQRPWHRRQMSICS